jgi:hypothetical protein
MYVVAWVTQTSSCPIIVSNSSFRTLEISTTSQTFDMQRRQSATCVLLLLKLPQRIA